MHTPIPVTKDHRIDELADELAGCRSDLSDEEQHMLSRQLAYRCRAFRRGHASLAKR